MVGIAGIDAGAPHSSDPTLPCQRSPAPGARHRGRPLRDDGWHAACPSLGDICSDVARNLCYRGDGAAGFGGAQLSGDPALARAGAHDAASKAYSGVIRAGEFDALGRQALFNLGNMYLRQGLAQDSNDALPLIELAKQRYRDLLRVAPDDWDARYNLERALRLAPEEQEAVAEEENTNIERRSVMLRGMDPGDLP